MNILLVAIIMSVPILASTIPPFQNHTIQSFIERHPNGTLTVAGPPMERCTYSSGGITCDEAVPNASVIANASGLCYMNLEQNNTSCA